MLDLCEIYKKAISCLNQANNHEIKRYYLVNHLACAQSSHETRSLHIQHGGIALRGLHEAIGNFSRANADAVLAASLCSESFDDWLPIMWWLIGCAVPTASAHARSNNRHQSHASMCHCQGA